MLKYPRRSIPWGAVVACGVAFAACDSTPADPSADAPTVGGDEITVMASVLDVVPVTSELNGHVYDATFVEGGITWDNARAAAEALTVGECQGYLVSLTSTEENDLIFTNFPEVVDFAGVGYWIGAYRDPAASSPELDWSWVSGEPFG